MKKAFSRFVVLVMVLGLICSFGLTQTKITGELFPGLKARNIGPANMSGRIGAIEGVASDPRIIYVGGAAGGVWKSTDGGLTWKSVFDDQPVASVGAIAVYQKNPSLVWVGTGEAAPRNSVSVGRGVYRSLDGGKTWQLMGLEKTEKFLTSSSIQIIRRWCWWEPSDQPGEIVRKEGCLKLLTVAAPGRKSFT